MDAMEKIQRLKPDVVTLDVEMPKLNGIDFLKKLMPVHPVPVVVVSSAPIRVLDALSAGAVEFIRKPEIKGPDGMKRFVTELSVKIRIAASAKVGKPRAAAPAAPAAGGAAGMAAAPVAAASGPALVLTRVEKDPPIIAIGASTGGTEAILAVVQDLPANTPGIVIVQHMPPVFTNMYAQRLDRICKMSVKEAAPGDRVERGKIIIGAGSTTCGWPRTPRGIMSAASRGPR